MIRNSLYLLFIIVVIGCSAEDCPRNGWDDEFPDDIVATAGIRQCAIYKVSHNDTVLLSQHFFDAKGRTDSAVYLINISGETFYEKLDFEGNSSYPNTIARYLLTRDSTGNELIFKSYKQGNKVYERYQDHGKTTNYSEGSFDSKGNRINRKFYSSDSTLIYYSIYEYDDYGLSRITKYSSDSSMTGYRAIEKGDATIIESTYIKDTLYLEVEKAYRDCSQLIQETTYTHGHEIESISSYEYNDLGLPQKSTFRYLSEDEEEVFHYLYK